MADEHFSLEIIERFFRSELSRGEAREFVRHLLRQCRPCLQLLQKVARGRSFPLLVSGTEKAALRFAPDLHSTILERILHMAERQETRPIQRNARGRALR